MRREVMWTGGMTRLPYILEQRVVERNCSNTDPSNPQTTENRLY